MTKTSYREKYLANEQAKYKADEVVKEELRKELWKYRGRKVTLEIMKGHSLHDKEVFYVTGTVKEVTRAGECRLDYSEPKEIKTVALFRIMSVEAP